MLLARGLVRCVSLTCLVACSGGGSSASGGVHVVDVVAEPVGRRQGMTELPRTPPSVLEGWRLPGSASSLGTACEPAPTGGFDATGVDPCGGRGRVSMEVVVSALRALPPCELRSLDGEGGRYSPYARQACLDGDHLVVATHCLHCRMPDAGTAVHARVSELTSAQQEYIAGLLELRGSPPGGFRALVEEAIRDGAP